MPEHNYTEDEIYLSEERFAIMVEDGLVPEEEAAMTVATMLKNGEFRESED